MKDQRSTSNRNKFHQSDRYDFSSFFHEEEEEEEKKIIPCDDLDPEFRHLYNTGEISYEYRVVSTLTATLPVNRKRCWD